MKRYGAWEAPEKGTFTMMEIGDHAGMKLIAGHDLLFEFEAATSEEASAIYTLRMGWGAYRPMGEAAPCPDCGAWYYPEGSGECWRCESEPA